MSNEDNNTRFWRWFLVFISIGAFFIGKWRANALFDELKDSDPYTDAMRNRVMLPFWVGIGIAITGILSAVLWFTIETLHNRKIQKSVSS